MKYNFILIGLLFSIGLFGQKNEYPNVSDLEGNGAIERVTLLKFRIPYGSNDLVLNDTCSYKFDSKGRIVLSKFGYISFPSVMIDSLVYDSKGNLIESYRFRPDRKTLESKYIMDFDAENNLISKKLFDGEDGVLSTYSLTKNTNDYKGYTKTFNDGSVRLSEHWYNQEGLKTKQIVSIKDSIIFNEMYEYTSSDKYKEIKHLDSEGNIVARTSFDYDAQGNRLIELKTKETNDELEYKYEYTYDKFNNKLTEKNSFPNGKMHEFKSEYFYDSKGNWIKQIAYRGDKKSDVYERKIEYR